MKDPGPALERLGRGEVKVVPDLLSYVASGGERGSEVYQTLAGAGEGVVPPLIEAMADDDPEVIAVAAGILGNIGDKRASAPIMAAFRKASSRRAVYLWALGQLREEGSLPLLVEVMTGENPVLAKEATRSVIKFGKPAVPALTGAVGSAPPGRRGYLFLALGDIGDKRAGGALLAVDPGPDREDWLRGLGKIGGPAAVPRAIEALSSPDGKIRIAAAQALWSLADLAAVPALTTAMRDDPEVLVREWAARALETITEERQHYRNDKGAMVLPYNLYR
jgi:HEAT repeat protein